MTTRRRVVLGLAAGALVAPLGSAAQPAAKPRRIGFLSSASAASYGKPLEAFRAALKTRGYVEGRDIAIDVRWADNRPDRLRALADELLAAQPAVIVTHGSPGVAALQGATSSVPIVFATASHPVGQGFVGSLKRPGGNITGVMYSNEIGKKVYDVVKAVLPSAKRVATLVNVKSEVTQYRLDDLPAIAKTHWFERMLVVHATRAEELEPAFEQAVKGRAHALVVSGVAPLGGLTAEIVKLQFKFRLPTFHGLTDAVEHGAVASYGFALEENFRRAAGLVARILKGENPAEIAVESPTRHEIAINLKSARALGIEVPKEALAGAQRVIQ